MTGPAGVQAYPPIGAVVEARVRGRVHSHIGLSGLTSTYGYTVKDEAGREVHIKDDARITTYEVLAPEQWPPLPGDIWADRDGTEYFFYADNRGDKLLLARTGDGKFVDRWVENRNSPIPGDRSVLGADTWVLHAAPGPLELRHRQSPVEETP